MSRSAACDETWMARALELARRATGDTHPNPLVGAVLVAGDGTVLGEGWHRRAGEPHAEVHALAGVPDPIPGDATLYVTLEPCCTHGRTPPCTDLILRRGIRRVVVGTTDPNPAHAGRGLERLRAAGVEVVSGVLADEAADLNLIFNHAITHGGEPLFAVKVAATLDGRTATRTGASQWITGPAAREEVHRWRRAFPAVATGVGTLLADNPRLTARLPGQPEWCGWRLLLDPRGASAEGGPWHLFTDAYRERTIVVATAPVPATARESWARQGVTVWELPEGPTGNGRVDLRALRRRCAEAGMTGVLWEPGPRLLGDLLAQGQVDYVLQFTAPIWWGDAQARPLAEGPPVLAPTEGWRLREVRHASFGEDRLTRGWLVHNGGGKDA